MNCRVEHDFVADAFKVWFYEVGFTHAGRVLRILDEDTFRWDEVENGVDAPPSLRLPREAFEALIRAGADVPGAEPAVVAHLADARDVRDRLLWIVEHKMGVRP